MSEVPLSPRGIFKKAIRDSDLDSLEQIHISHPEIVRELPVIGPWLNLAGKKSSTKIVAALLNFGADPNLKDEDSQRNSIASAASNGRLDNVKLLHTAGAILDTSETTANPLFASVHGSSVEVAQYLLDAGIDSTIKYKTRRPLEISALDFAWEMGRRDIARAIAAHQTNGDPARMQQLLDEADRIAHENTEPVEDDV